MLSDGKLIVLNSANANYTRQIYLAGYDPRIYTRVRYYSNSWQWHSWSEIVGINEAVGFTLASGVTGTVNVYRTAHLLFVNLNDVQISNVASYAQTRLATFNNRIPVVTTTDLPILDGNNSKGYVRITSNGIDIASILTTSQNFRIFTSGYAITL